MSERFYTNCPLELGAEVELTGAEAHHLTAVMRARPGDAVDLFCGDGRESRAEVVSAGKRTVLLRVVSMSAPERELRFRLEMAAPLPKGDRAQFLVEKLTELGVTDFVPLRTRRSVVHPGDAKLEKLERMVIEASKQCGRNVLMRVKPLADWDRYLLAGQLPALRVLAHPGGTPLTEVPRRADVAAAVGPEGGFTEEEMAAAVAAGWRPVGLGPRVLRVETAALAVAALLTSPEVSPATTDSCSPA